MNRRHGNQAVAATPRASLAVAVLIALAAGAAAATAATDKVIHQPAPRYDHVLSTLPDGRILLFGGDDGGALGYVPEDDDTWVWDGVSFTNRSIGGGGYGPAPRTGAAMAAGVLSGGLDYGTTTSNETWTYGVFADQWIKCPGCAYNPGNFQAACGLRLLNTNSTLAHAYVTSYGTGPYFATYEHTTGWYAAQSTATPPLRLGHAMASIGATKAAIFGGATNATSLIEAPAGTGTWQTYVLPGSPSARSGAGLAAESANGNTYILFGGSTLDARTWRLTQATPASASTWQVVATDGPPPRDGTALAYDPNHGTVLLFGGTVNGTALNDLWEWTPATSRWARRSCVEPIWLDLTAGATPPARNGHCVAWDPDRKVAVLFGGRDGAPLGDTWEYDGSTWTQVSASGPAARFDAAMAYDDARQEVVLFGGTDGANRLGDTWVWKNGSWFLRSVSGGPSARSGAMMAFDFGGMAITLVGGDAGDPLTTCKDTWKWDGWSWSQVGSGGMPVGLFGSGLSYAAMTYDLGHSRLVVYGGALNRHTANAQCFLWNHATGTWSTAPLAPGSPVPPARSGTALAWNAGRGRLLMFGGIDAVGCRGDSWELACDASSGQWSWQELSIPGASARAGHGMYFDGIRGGVMLFGGRDNAWTSRADTWCFLGDAMQDIVATDSAQHADPGAPVTLVLQHTGGVLTCSWSHNGTLLPGVTGTSHTIAAATLADAGTYLVRAIGPCSSEDAAIITLEVSSRPPTITAQPVGQTICDGSPLTLSVTADGTPPLQYQWWFDDAAQPQSAAPITGATGPTYTLAHGHAEDAGTYWVQVTNAQGMAVSDGVTVTVNPSVVFTRQPSGATRCPGQPVTLRAGAAGAIPGHPLEWQWVRNGVPLAGANDSTLTVGANELAVDSYTAVVVGACGVAISNTVGVTAGSPPTIIAQPASQSTCGGAPVTFTVGAAGSRPFTYQWQFNGANVPGATDSSLTIGAPTAGSQGLYRVLVANVCGDSVASDPAQLTVGGAPAFSQQPAANTVCDGGPASFSAVATGSPPPSYRWFHNGLEITGQTAATLSFAATTPTAGVYRAEARTPGCGATLSQRAPLTTACGAASWVQSPGPGPQPRAAAAMAYDHARGRTVLFGGVDDNGAIYYGDTWERDSATGAWTQVASSGPPARQGGVLVHDPLRQVTWLYGGHSVAGGNAVYHQDLWQWDGAVWTQVTGLATTPGPRWGHAMTWDADHGVVVLYGGWNGGPPNVCGDTWTWNGLAWTQVSTTGPGPRALMAMTYDLARGRVVLFGGVDETGQGYLGGPGQKNDTWTWDGAAWTLAATTGPAARQGHVLCYDNVYNTAIMFGGAGGGALLTDTWSWDGATWTRRALNGPTPRMYLPAAYDEQNGEVLIFGGFDAGVDWSVGGTWAWTETVGPSAVDDSAPALSFAGPAQLLPCVPNPFNPRTELRFALAEPLTVTLRIYDLQGRCVRTAVSAQPFGAGAHAVPWDGTADDGQRVASGVYHLRMTAGRYAGSQRLVLIK